MCWWTLSRRGQEAEQGVPYQDDRKIRLGLANMNDILIFENRMMHVYEESKCPRLNRNYMYIALEMEKTQMARRPTRWTVVGVGLKACMEA